MNTSSRCPEPPIALAVTLTFSGPLKGLLAADQAAKPRIDLRLERCASIKDLVESFGVPHTEIATLLVNSQPVSFSHIVGGGARSEVIAPTPPVDLSAPSLLRPPLAGEVKFAVDANVGKLARLLRLAGFDTFYENPIDDGRLAEVAAAEHRILLTRDRRLLNRRIIQHAHLVRACQPRLQLKEVLDFYGLACRVNPFSRCLVCNSKLTPVAKAAVDHRLLPLTRRYYNDFSRCPRCDKIYWPGSHRDRMEELLAASGASAPKSGD